MKACPRCTRAYSPLDIYCGSCGTIRCADKVPKFLRRFVISQTVAGWKVEDRYGPAWVRVASFAELEHAEMFRNCLVALELGKNEDDL